MAIELEAKMKLTDPAAIRARLRAMRAIDHGLRFEVNSFFDTSDRALLSKDSGLRLRSMRRADGATSSVITFKGPQDSGFLKSRTEIEFGIADIAQARALLEALGYTLLLSFEKRRESWEMDGCQIELDELPVLGRFIEIEGPDEVTVMSVRSRLGLEGEPLITRGYSALLSEAISGGLIGGPDVRFSAGEVA